MPNGGARLRAAKIGQEWMVGDDMRILAQGWKTQKAMCRDLFLAGFAVVRPYDSRTRKGTEYRYQPHAQAGSMNDADAPHGETAYGWRGES